MKYTHRLGVAWIRTPLALTTLTWIFAYFKVNGPFPQTFCIEKDLYMDAI